MAEIESGLLEAKGTDRSVYFCGWSREILQSSALGIGFVACYFEMMNAAVKNILGRVATWPEEDQEELAALAREIEARRTGVYNLSDDEKVAIDAARRSGLASDGEIAAFWRRHGVA